MLCWLIYYAFELIDLSGFISINFYFYTLSSHSIWAIILQCKLSTLWSDFLSTYYLRMDYIDRLHDVAVVSSHTNYWCWIIILFMLFNLRQEYHTFQFLCHFHCLACKTGESEGWSTLSQLAFYFIATILTHLVYN